MSLKTGSRWSNWAWDKPVKAFIWRSSRICRPIGGLPPWFLRIAYLIFYCGTTLILFTLDAASRTKFAIRSFGGVKVYLNAWLDAKAARAKHAALEQKKVAQQREQRLRDQYEIWWHREVTKLRN